MIKPARTAEAGLFPLEGAPTDARAMETPSTLDPARLRRMQFRAWHRGTREADYMIGGYFDRYSAGWSEAEAAWFEALLEEDDVEIMAWALQTAPVPDRFAGAQMDLMRKLDYVDIPR